MISNDGCKMWQCGGVYKVLQHADSEMHVSGYMVNKCDQRCQIHSNTMHWPHEFIGMQGFDPT
jgi:hypothetical protein